MRTSTLRLPRFSLRFAGSGRIEDMRAFMQALYTYWYNKGFWGATVSSAVDFFNTLALFVVGVVFTMRFDWSIALTCAEAECATHRLVHGLHVPYIFHPTMWGYIWGFALVSSTCVACAYEMTRFVEMYYLQSEVEEVAREAGVDTGFLTPLHRWHYQWQRGVDGREGHVFVGRRGGSGIVLSTAGWGEFLEVVCAAVGRSGSVKFGAPGETLDPLRAMQALMQLENYLIAIHDCDALKGTALSYVGPGTLTMLLASMFDAFRTVESRHRAMWAVRSTMVLSAVLYSAGYLFFFLYSVLKVLVKNAAQVKVNYWTLSQRTWTAAAEWRFRLYNEVEHLHASRLRAGGEVAEAMVTRLRISNSVSRLVRRVCGICVLVTALLSFLNPGLLIGGSIGGLTLVWWLTLALTLYACVPEVDPREREYAYAADLEALVQHLYFETSEWFESADVFYDHLTKHFFKNRLQVVLTDLLKNLALPVVLLYALYDGSVETLVSFVVQHSTTVDGVGSIAVGSDWSSAAFAASTAYEEDQQEREFSDTEGGGRSTVGKVGASSAMLLSCGAVTTAGSITGTAQRRARKVQQSVASFAAVYSSWNLRHIDGPIGEAPVGATSSGVHDASLEVFLRELSHRVCESSRIGPADPLLESTDSFVPPFTARTEPNRAGPRETAVDESGDRVGVVLPFAAASTTAHEREQLFVSQIPSSHFHSSLHASRVGQRRRGGNSYGTGG
jgi:autophagy-related protein 9